MRLVTALAVLSLAACTRAPSAATPPAPEPECTLSTPLIPGVPGSPGHLIPSDLNPNGASELATLMRAMVADLEAGKATLEKGQALPKLWSRHRKMRCAWPTDLHDRNPDFDGMAIHYLTQVQALDAEPSSAARFNAVVDACRACHENTCPGPIEKIVQLKVATAAAP